MFREDKAVAMAAYFLDRAENKSLNDIKLMKLLYIAERMAVERDGVPIALDDYASMRHGPVLSRTYDFMKPTAPKSFWSEHIHAIQYNGEENVVKLKRLPDIENILRESEFEILDQVWTTFGNLGKWNLREYCHKFPEYNQNAENPVDGEPKAYPFSLKDMLIGLGMNSEEAESVANEIRALAG